LDFKTFTQSDQIGKYGKFDFLFTIERVHVQFNILDQDLSYNKLGTIVKYCHEFVLKITSVLKFQITCAV
jgi:hypothetical protein